MWVSWEITKETMASWVLRILSILNIDPKVVPQNYLPNFLASTSQGAEKYLDGLWNEEKLANELRVFHSQPFIPPVLCMPNRVGLKIWRALDCMFTYSISQLLIDFFHFIFLLIVGSLNSWTLTHALIQLWDQDYL